MKESTAPLETANQIFVRMLTERPYLSTYICIINLNLEYNSQNDRITHTYNFITFINPTSSWVTPQGLWDQIEMDR
jgi:hypothetical protein